MEVKVVASSGVHIKISRDVGEGAQLKFPIICSFFISRSQQTSVGLMMAVYGTVSLLHICVQVTLQTQ